jgi:hypothetical protein
MHTNGCGHFSTEVEQIALPHTPVVLRVPVRRCALAERMIALLSKTDEGRMVGGKIQLMGSDVDSGGDGLPSRIRAAFGPDLEAINRTECTAARCQESCTPGFRQMVSHFGYLNVAEQETGDGCLEIAPDMADAAM